MKLKGYKKIEGIIEVVTGLHIGGSTAIIEIGGMDNPVIKHPITKEPYIPGSSIKGKMRSLLEWKHDKIDTDPNSKNFGEVHKCNKDKKDKNEDKGKDNDKSEDKDKRCPICVIFGTSADEANTGPAQPTEAESLIGPTRLIVRDAVLNKGYKEEQEKKNLNWTILDLTEDKCENSINRITAKANPRHLERVVSGVKFSFCLSYRVFEYGDNSVYDDAGLFKYILEGLRLIEDDALGGAGSRGCGQVKFWINLNGMQKGLSEVNALDFPTVD